jgi:hypothetical protein
MVIDNIQQLAVLEDHDVFLHPIPMDDRLHPSCSSIIAFGIVDIQTSKSYIVSVAHPEGLFHIDNLDFLKGAIYTTNKALLHANGYMQASYDVEMISYLKTNKGFEIESQTLATHYTRTLSKMQKINALVDLVKLEEQTTTLYKKHFSTNHPGGLSFYSDTLKQSLIKIQSHGIQIDPILFEETFGTTFARQGDKCFTQYNFYTTTGRPSNRFGGINFAALPKEDQTRTCFVSRFENGCLVELDFNSYHPRLIADIIGYNFGAEDAYHHLAKKYHNTDTPTQAQITKAKEDTFRQLYGGIKREYLDIPFFAATDMFSKQIWKHMITHGYVDSLISGRRLLMSNYQEINEYTLFNYYIQMYETEKNAAILKNILEYLQTYLLKSVPILYTYDSILFDVHPDEFNTIVTQMLPSCIDTDAFPIKLKKGLNYKNMTPFEVV